MTLKLKLMPSRQLGFSVHFTHSAMHVARLVSSSTASVGYHVFMAIAKRIPDEPSMGIVQDAFDVLRC